MYRKISRKVSLILALTLCILAVCAPPAALADPEDGAPLLIKKGDEGDNVILLQMRLSDLGYFDTQITGYFGQVTEEAVKAFQKENKLTQDGQVGQQTSDVLFSNEAVREPVVAVKKPAPKVVRKSPVGKMRDWYTYVNKRWPRGGKCQVIDFATGVKYNMIRVGGSQHADVEPATKSDCAKLLSTYGGSWSWDRRAVVVRIGGEWIAGSTNGFPHGYETVAGNNMNGQVCIHFLNSKTHCGNAACPNHQRMVQRAAGK
ncbi:MAG: peptidoglycan-binding protein [Clostridiales bacterium]|nr:peptidoglycan-binding protein [Clostridiales bacterium]